MIYFINGLLITLRFILSLPFMLPAFLIGIIVSLGSQGKIFHFKYINLLMHWVDGRGWSVCKCGYDYINKCWCTADYLEVVRDEKT